MSFARLTERAAAAAIYDSRTSWTPISSMAKSRYAIRGAKRTANQRISFHMPADGEEGTVTCAVPVEDSACSLDKFLSKS